jgi:hypothetical protein
VRLFLGIPTAGSPAQPFLESLGRLTLPSTTTAFTRSIVTGNFIPAQRDVLLSQALAWNADFIVMCDDDMVLPSDALATLCELARSDAVVGIAGALYYSRDGLRPMAVEDWDSSDTGKGCIPAFGASEPVPVSGVGFGCVVIRAAAVKTLQKPYFSAHVYVEPSAGRVRVCNEDYLFCDRVRAAGYAVVLHPGVRCGHYDRARNAVAPATWESPETTNVRRVAIQSGSEYKTVPLERAPQAAILERHVRADVTYVETVSTVQAPRSRRNGRAVYLHIGTHKTGTTSLQAFVTANAQPLGTLGVHVPRAGRPIRHFGSAYVGHHNVAWELSGYVQYQAADGGLRELAAEIAQIRPPSVLLSSEDFEFLHTKPEALGRLAATFDELGYPVHVVVYLRPQSEYVQAIYSEHSKASHLIDHDAYLAGILQSGTYVPAGAVDVYTGVNRFEYGPLVAAFADAFGKDRVIVRPYHAGRNPDALLQEFLVLVGAEALPMSALIRPQPLNISPSLMHVLAGMHAGVVARNPDAQTPEQLMRERFPGDDGAAFTKKFDVLRQAEIDRLVERFRDDNQRIEAEYGAEIAFRSQGLPPRNPAAWATVEKQRELLDFATERWGIRAQ